MLLAINGPFEEEDFDEMYWHDVHIHALAFSCETFQLFMDIDYIFAWVNPEPPDVSYSFWKAPCTLVFSYVYDFTADIETGFGLWIDKVIREDAGRPWNADYIKREQQWIWTFECQEGEFSFHAIDYQLFVRAQPTQTKSQVFSWEGLPLAVSP